MKFTKVTFRFQKSSRSVSFSLPSFLVCVPLLVKMVAVVGVLLFIVQLLYSTTFDGNMNLQLRNRQKLNREISKIQETLDDLNKTSAEFISDENLLYARYGLPAEDISFKEFSTGGELSPDSMLLRSMSPIFERVSALAETANRIHAKLEKTDETFHNLNKYVARRNSQWHNVPTISPTTGRYASSFGPRIHPVTGEVGKPHKGMDIANDPWTPIFATADGVVEVAKYSESFGNYVAINHGNGYKTRFGHMNRFVVHQGEFVKRYQLIGYMGTTGRSTGPHLHYEVWLNGEAVNPIAYILPSDYSVD